MGRWCYYLVFSFLSASSTSSYSSCPLARRSKMDWLFLSMDMLPNVWLHATYYQVAFTSEFQQESLDVMSLSDERIRGGKIVPSSETYPRPTPRSFSRYDVPIWSRPAEKQSQRKSKETRRPVEIAKKARFGRRIVSRNEGRFDPQDRIANSLGLLLKVFVL